MRRKIVGLISLCVGLGIILGLLIPMWVLVIAAALIIFGVWNLFLC
ncbi:MAG: hypothetical protein FWC55_04305 [Firmicutes bacterium]|nr:hypothetical protein [Bacillota bacterium]